MAKYRGKKDNEKFDWLDTKHHERWRASTNNYLNLLLDQKLARTQATSTSSEPRISSNPLNDQTSIESKFEKKPLKPF